MRLSSLFLLLVVGFSPIPLAAAGPDDVKGRVEAGEILPFEPIRNRVVAQTPGDYIGVEFDPATLRYRFRFLVGGNVVNVDIDARTGRRLVARQSF
jgi:uncharacterized membrane protein YkoI